MNPLALESADGWNFTAKWTGVFLETLFAGVGLQEGASHVIFYGADEYSTDLPLDYLIENEIILAHRPNNVTLPPERGASLTGRGRGKIWIQVGKMDREDGSYG